MIRRPPRSTLTDTLFPYTTLFPSPLAVGHVEEVGVSAGVELIGPVQTHAALVEQVGQHPVDNRRAKLRLDVVADDRNACLGETLRPYRIAGDEDGDVVHERSEERRVGKECVSTCSSRWSPYP